jgi:hypothetical protein
MDGFDINIDNFFRCVKDVEQNRWQIDQERL